MAKLILVIETERLAGAGTEKDPLHTVVQYFSINGELLAERGPFGIAPAPRVQPVTR